jgi:pyruvate carboxylase subunit B
MSIKRIHVMDTSFRDGFQSVFGARVLTPDFLPALEAAVEAGITHFEAAGGARFQSLYFYCNEDAFASMDLFRKTVGPEINLQSLARGINVVGLDSQPADIIDLHAKLFKKHGMTTIRNFDALNDPDNLKYSGECIKKYGLKHEVSIALMDLPPGCQGAHDVAFYTKVLEAILAQNIPFDSICFKDASGTSHPRKVYETIKTARDILPKDTFIRFHTHESAGVSVACYMAALEAGADGIDLAMEPVSGGTSQPDILTMIHALKNTQWDLGLDAQKILRAEEVFKDCMKDYFFPPEALVVSPLIPFSPMPGGALTSNTQMMRDSNMLDKFPEVIRAMQEVVRKGGFGTSVTPVSQFYFQQALNNVMFGPWKKIADGYGKMVLGYYGKTPVAPDKDIIDIASEQLKLAPTKESPMERDNKNPQKGIPAAITKLNENQLQHTEENIFIAATCQDKGIAFLKGQAKLQIRREEKKSSKKETQTMSVYSVLLDQTSYEVVLDKDRVTVNGKVYQASIEEKKEQNQAHVPISQDKTLSIDAPMSGQLVNVFRKTGDTVKVGDVILVMEAMKMEIEIKSPFKGVISEINLQVGDAISTGQKLLWIKAN